MKALIVIDMQNDFIDGRLGTDEAKEIIPRVASLINDSVYDKVFFTRDTHDENYLDTNEGKKLPIMHCIKGTPEWNISSMLNIEGAEIIDKPTFGYIGWKGKLDGYEKIDIVGLCTDICVISNALVIESFYPNAEISIIENATAGTTPDKKISALDVARSCLINVI